MFQSLLEKPDVSTNCTLKGRIDFYKLHFHDIWDNTSKEFYQPLLLDCENDELRIKNERKFNKFLRHYLIRSKLYKLFRVNNYRDKKVNLLKDFTIKLKLYLNLMFSGKFLSNSASFSMDVSNGYFDIPRYDIYQQAIRNIFVIDILQLLFDIPQEYTKSIYSYNMIYLCTDNYFDNSVIGFNEKMSFCSRFRSRICGESDLPENKEESLIFGLIKNFEDEHPRTNSEKLYESLLLLQLAQEKSLGQIKKIGAEINIDDILNISMEKGGLAVLADGYLVKDNLAEKDEYFLFGLGIILQFIDDLIDVKEDMENARETIFTHAALNSSLEEMVCRLINYCSEFFTKNEIIRELNEEIRCLLYEVTIAVVIEAVSDNQEYLSGDFLRNLESKFMFRLKYYNKLVKIIHNELMNLIF